MKKIERNILFRPSEMGSIMTNAKGRSNKQQYDELGKQIETWQARYDGAKNKETKTAQELLIKIGKASKERDLLLPVLNEVLLSETTKKQLLSKAVELRYGRYEDFENRYTTKGIDCEEESITIYSQYHGKLLENNHDKVQNDYYRGIIDVPWWRPNKKIFRITDIKTAYTIHTFSRHLFDVSEKLIPQGIGYLDLYPDAEEYVIAHVLTNNTDDGIRQQLYRETFKWEEGEVPRWRELQIIKEHIFDTEAFHRFVQTFDYRPNCEKSEKLFESFVEVPLEERVIEHTIKRDDEVLQAQRTRIDECREFMAQEFNIIHNPDA